MKQRKILFVLAFLCLQAWQGVYAHDIEVANADGVTIYYVWTNNKTELAVSYRGNSYDSYSVRYSGTVIIPKSVIYNGKSYPVTSIGNRAFYYCGGLTSVTIPGSVTSIGEWAFSGCSRLTSVTIPNSVTSIGGGAFYQCRGLTSVSIPSSVTSTDYQAFEYCTSLTSVHITDLAAWCKISFNGSTSNPLRYAHHLYLNGVEIRDLVIPNGVTSIGNYAFYGCSDLVSVSIPNSVTSIGDYAFEDCSGLTSVTIPNSVTRIGHKAFYGCSGLTSVTIPNSVTSIGESAFSGCSGLTSVTIPNSVTSIGRFAFSGCSGLTSVTIGNGVTRISSDAFAYCSGLTSVTIPESVTEIGGSAFAYCSGLTSVTIPSSVTIIDGGAFEGCSSLTSVTIPNSVTIIGGWAFSDCSGLTSVTIPNSVTNIRQSAFEGCSGLTSVTIGNSVTSIGNRVFQDCGRLTSVTIPNSVTSIGESAFSGCSGLKTITIPNSVTELGISAFEKCTALESVTIGENVKIIRQNLFAGCTKIKQVTSNIKEPLNMVKSVFADNVYTQATLTVPDGTTSKYLSCDGWKDFVNIKEQGQQSSFILTISGNAGGKISYGSQVVSGGTGRIGVSRNQSVTLTITPDEGYEIQSVTLNGNDVTGDLYDNTYTIAQIKENFDFVVTFAISPMYVTIQYADGGCVKHQVEKGKTYNYLIAPADGWQIHSVSFNGNDVTAELSSKNVFTTPAITSNSVLNVVFEKGGTTGVVAQAESRLRVTAHGNTISVQGAEAGEQIAVYSVDGKLVETVKTTHGSATITLPENETYIVKGRQKTVKVRL